MERSEINNVFDCGSLGPLYPNKCFHVYLKETTGVSAVPSVLAGTCKRVPVVPGTGVPAATGTGVLAGTGLSTGTSVSAGKGTDVSVGTGKGIPVVPGTGVLAVPD